MYSKRQARAVQDAAARDKELFLQRVAELRKERGLTQVQVSVAAGLGPNYLSDLKNGSHSPKADNVRSIAATLECDPRYLLGTTDDPAPPGAALPPKINQAGRRALRKFEWADADGFAAVSVTPEPLPLDISIADGFRFRDDQNAPRYRAGDIVLTGQQEAPPGSFSVVMLKDGRAAVREIVTVERDGIRVRAISDPQSEAKISLENLLSYNKIVGTREP